MLIRLYCTSLHNTCWW